MENNMKFDTRFAAINDIANNSAYYIALAGIDKATVARILFEAGYCSSYAKRINSEYPKRQQWDICKENASDVIKICKAVKGFLDNESYYIPDSGDGWDSGYKYAIQIDGTFKDNELGIEIYCSEGALNCIVESANLFNKAFHETYNTYNKWADSAKINRLAQFTNGLYKTFIKESGRRKAARAMALYHEAIRHRNASYAIKYGL